MTIFKPITAAIGTAEHHQRRAWRPRGQSLAPHQALIIHHHLR